MPRLIDADVLKEKILSLTGMFDDGGFYVGMDAVLGMIDFQNAIDPESLRPHGRWEKSEDGCFGLALLECSLCRGECFDIDEDIELVNYRYCPNCGAKMDLEEEMTIDQD